jgi:hypothetical protein
MSALASRPASTAPAHDSVARAHDSVARAAALVAAALLGGAAVVALAVNVAGQAGAREALAFSFPELPRTAGEALDILLNNLRVLAGVLLAALVARVAATTMRPLVHVCDAALVLAASVHAVLIGAGIAAYGDRMVAALLPHGPLELAAFSLALGLYVRVRRHPLPARTWAATAGTAVLLLTIAAPVEVFLAL